jgi:DNA-binding NarL/FixJ family response regulator
MFNALIGEKTHSSSTKDVTPYPVLQTSNANMIKIAIVEDNKIIRNSLAETIRTDRECNCVCICATAEDALKEIPKKKPDIILMDIELPGSSGIECTTRLKQILPSVQIIMVTVYEDPERIFKALRAGACGYLLKRCAIEDVLRAIHEVQQGGAAMSGEVARKVIGSFQQPASASTDVEDLTPREREILELLAEGFSNKEIADKLSLTDGTVRWHLRHVYHKLHVQSRTKAVLKFRSAEPRGN